MVGALFDEVAADTVIVNADNDFESVPSLTLMTMLLCVPVAVGVPDNVPVEVEKLAQLGLFWMLYPSVSPSGSDAVGLKLYAVPTFADVLGGSCRNSLSP